MSRPAPAAFYRNGTADTHEECSGDVLLRMARSRGDARMMDGDQLRQARIDAGLTLIEAASLVGCSSYLLESIELDAAAVWPSIAARMNDIYGLGTMEEVA